VRGNPITDEGLVPHTRFVTKIFSQARAWYSEDEKETWSLGKGVDGATEREREVDSFRISRMNRAALRPGPRLRDVKDVEGLSSEHEAERDVRLPSKAARS